MTAPVSDPLGLLGSRVFVAGATGLVGRAVANAFAAQGAALVLHAGSDLDGAKRLADEVAATHTVEAKAVLADLSDPRALDLLGTEVPSGAARHLDVVVGSITAFDGRPLSVDALDVAEFRRVVEVDLVGSYSLVRTLLPLLRRAKAGRVVLMSSLAGVRGRTGAAHLCAAKAGVLGLVRALAIDLGPSGIAVNAVAPGPVRRPGVEYPVGPAGPLALSDADDVSRAVLFLASALAAGVNGDTLMLEGRVA